MKRIIPIILILIFMPVPAYANFDDAVDAHNRGDFKTEFKEWKLLAEQGDSLKLAISGQLNLGGCITKELE